MDLSCLFTLFCETLYHWTMVYDFLLKKYFICRLCKFNPFFNVLTLKTIFEQNERILFFMINGMH